MNRSIVALDRALVGFLNQHTGTEYALSALRCELIRGVPPYGKYAWRRAADKRSKTLIRIRARSLARAGKIRWIRSRARLLPREFFSSAE